MSGGVSAAGFVNAATFGGGMLVKGLEVQPNYSCVPEGRSIVVTHEDPVVGAFRGRQTKPKIRALLRDNGRVAEALRVVLT
jgi:hypothetical protein